jgi:hypothetical protein
MLLFLFHAQAFEPMRPECSLQQRTQFPDGISLRQRPQSQHKHRLLNL